MERRSEIICEMAGVNESESVQIATAAVVFLERGKRKDGVEVRAMRV